MKNRVRSITLILIICCSVLCIPVHASAEEIWLDSFYEYLYMHPEYQYAVIRDINGDDQPEMIVAKDAKTEDEQIYYSSCALLLYNAQENNAEAYLFGDKALQLFCHPAGRVIGRESKDYYDTLIQWYALSEDGVYFHIIGGFKKDVDDGIQVSGKAFPDIEIYDFIIYWDRIYKGYDYNDIPVLSSLSAEEYDSYIRDYENLQSITLMALADFGMGLSPEGNQEKAKEMSEQGFALYHQGNDLEALKCFSQAASCGDSDSFVMLGYIFASHAEDIEMDLGSGDYFLRAAEMGNPAGMAMLGYMLTSTELKLFEYEEALGWFQDALEAYKKRDENGNIKEDRLEEIVNREQILSHLNTVGRTLTILSETPDYEMGMQYYQLAYEFGDKDAPANIGDMYKNGRGVPEDQKTAFNWYLKAADLGNMNECLYVGLQYGLGLAEDGHVFDADKGLQYLKKAHELGSEKAVQMIELIGLLHLDGDMMSQMERYGNQVGESFYRDKEIGTEYIKCAAEYGSESAQKLAAML